MAKKIVLVGGIEKQKKSGATILIENIRATQNQFLNMTSEERIAFIERYEKLQPFQTTALMQCKKFMTPAEKKTYKAAVQKAAEKNSGPQPE